MGRATDCIFLELPSQTGTGVRVRRWDVLTPRASDACALRARIVSAAPTLVDAVVGLVLGPELQAAEQMEAHAAAHHLFTNARAGRCIRALFAGNAPVEKDRILEITEGNMTAERPRREPGIQFRRATQLLDLLRAKWATEYSRGADASALFGEWLPGNKLRVGLLYHLAYASDARLVYDSEGPGNGYIPKSPLLLAGDPEAYTHALDDVALSADELDLVFLLCLIHAWRPF